MSNKSHFFRQSSGGGGDAFIATFRTTSANESITLPYLSNGTYSGTIDFGDGTVVANSYANRTHTYVNSGDYDVTILGEILYFSFEEVNISRLNIVDVKQFGDIILGQSGTLSTQNGYAVFQSCTNLDISATDTPDLSTLFNLRRFFRSCSALVYNNSLNDWDVSSVENLNSFFISANSINVNINDWDVSNVTDMSYTFATNSYNQPLNNWNTSSVITFFATFNGATIFNQPLNNWDVSSSLSMDLMFYNAKAFNQPLNDWDVSSVESFLSMFFGASDFNQPLNNWNTSSVKTMKNMFFATSDFNQDVSQWDYSSLNNVDSLNPFIRGVSPNYDTNYYDNLLIKWASSPSLGGLQPNIIGTIDMGTIKYTVNGASARASILANNKAQTIIDGGQI
tara:strand:- start:530 stop:1714 length:1185 start_codon:yes stop_codon:yes gene_type:complete